MDRCIPEREVFERNPIVVRNPARNIGKESI